MKKNLSAIEQLDSYIAFLRQQVSEATDTGHSVVASELTILLKTAEGRRKTACQEATTAKRRKR